MWRQTREVFRNKINNWFLIFPWFRIRFKISRSWHFFNFPNRLLIRLDDKKQKENGKKNTFCRYMLYAKMYTIIRCWALNETTNFKRNRATCPKYQRCGRWCCLDMDIFSGADNLIKDSAYFMFVAIPRDVSMEISQSQRLLVHDTEISVSLATR
jgi:hypothetical protein